MSISINDGAYIDFGGDPLPNTYGNITINYTAYKSGSFNSTTMPTSFTQSTVTNRTYGMPDITFVPDS